MCGTTAVRATLPWGFAKSFGPAGALQRRSAKCFGAKELVELRQRQAGLKLNAVHGHDASLKIGRWVQMTPSQVHQVSLAEDCC
jgi:hypothetical protein